MKEKKSTLIVSTLIILVSLFGFDTSARAAEGGLSHYLPGVAGDVLLAQSPKPGLQSAMNLWYQNGDVDKTVLQGRLGADLDLDLFLFIPAAIYTFEKKVLGGTYTLGIAVPFGYGKLEGELTDPFGHFGSASQDSFNLSDIALTPLQLNWDVGNFHFKLAEVLVAPTGGYDLDNVVNLGRNYWSFDTVAGMTWFNAPTGTEMSLAPGIMVNTENNKTNYRTGTEFHLDFTANQFLSETFSLGIRGFYYKQISGDSGSGTLLGDFKAEEFSIGPGLVWIPKSGGGDLTILGKWMHDFYAENTFDSDYFTLTVAWKL